MKVVLSNLIAIVLLVASSAQAQKHDYDVVPLAPISISASPMGLDISAKGLVVGNNYNGTDAILPTLWSAPSAPATLPVIEFDGADIEYLYQGEASGVSRSGRYIAGSNWRETEGDPVYKPVVWDNGTPRLLSVPGKCSYGAASKVNDRGLAIGRVCGAAVIWGSDRVTVLEGALSSASDISRSQVVGTFRQSLDSPLRAFRFKIASETMDLLPSLRPGGQASAFAVNDRGFAVGHAEIAGPPSEEFPARAVAWTPGGQIVKLGRLPGETRSTALDINNHGQMVGASSGVGNSSAVLWTAKGRVVDLNNVSAGVAGRLTLAHAISDNGVILASHQTKGGVVPVVLIPRR